MKDQEFPYYFDEVIDYKISNIYTNCLFAEDLKCTFSRDVRYGMDLSEFFPSTTMRVQIECEFDFKKSYIDNGKDFKRT